MSGFELFSWQATVDGSMEMLDSFATELHGRKIHGNLI